ncbi:MAG: GNAT family N-acetyltransferase [Lutibacter sp.]|uniref:GNAT family N-acetyltransferase n=1 Tax=Lutibacter sp. TaxID=1925666 RepID=UPI00299F4130|nr:GNAT family N-acetyltransferase [Lutibacter sp.]MDX1829817.1 GNAT family N-acetyltransferase [Lutibacter sp.]
MEKRKKKMKFEPFPILKTERLYLRKIKESDSDVILFLRSNKTVNKFIERPENKRTKNKNDALKFIKEITAAIEKNKSISWGITLKDNPQIIGTICLWNFSKDKKTAEVGYDLNPKFQQKGIMNEALKNVINFGFNLLKLDKIEAFTHKNNISSIRLLEKNKFEFIKDKKDEYNSDNIIFELKNSTKNTV